MSKAFIVLKSLQIITPQSTYIHLGLSFERPIRDATGVTLQITKVENSSYDLHGWLWVEVTGIHHMMKLLKITQHPSSQLPPSQLQPTQHPLSQLPSFQLLPTQLPPSQHPLTCHLLTSTQSTSTL